MNSCCFFPTVAIPMNVVRHFAERHVACNTLFRTDQWLVCETITIRLWCVRVWVTHSELHLVCYFFASQYIAIKQNVHVAFWIVFLTKEHLMNVSKKFTHIFPKKHWFLLDFNYFMLISVQFTLFYAFIILEKSILCTKTQRKPILISTVEMLPIVYRAIVIHIHFAYFPIIKWLIFVVARIPLWTWLRVVCRCDILIKTNSDKINNLNDAHEWKSNA